MSPFDDWLCVGFKLKPRVKHRTIVIMIHAAYGVCLVVFSSFIIITSDSLAVWDTQVKEAVVTPPNKVRKCIFYGLALCPGGMTAEQCLRLSHVRVLLPSVKVCRRLYIRVLSPAYWATLISVMRKGIFLSQYSKLLSRECLTKELNPMALWKKNQR